jgi:hypothetical protein
LRPNESAAFPRLSHFGPVSVSKAGTSASDIIPNAANAVKSVTLLITIVTNGIKSAAELITNVTNAVKSVAFAIPNVSNWVTKVPDGTGLEAGFGGQAAVGRPAGMDASAWAGVTTAGIANGHKKSEPVV